MIIVQLSDFKGFQVLGRTNADDPILQEYIDRYERQYIYRLLGKALGDLFIADLVDGIPQTAIYQEIFNAFTVDYNSCLKASRGMKDILVSIILYHFVTDSQNVHTASGVVKQTVETSSVVSPETAFRFAESKWNDAVPSWEAIQWYIKTYKNGVYPTYNGQPTSPSWSALL